MSIITNGSQLKKEEFRIVLKIQRKSDSKIRDGNYKIEEEVLDGENVGSIKRMDCKSNGNYSWLF